MTSQNQSEPKKQTGFLVSVILVFLCSTIWGCAPIFWKQLTTRILDPWYTCCTRVVFSCVWSFLIVLATRKFHEVNRLLKSKRDILIIALGGVATAANWALYILSVSTDRIKDASLAYFIGPIFFVVTGLFFFKEKPTTAQWISVGIASIGVLVAVIAGGDFPILAILIAIAYIIYSSVMKLVNASPAVLVFLETLTVLPFTLGYMIYDEVTGKGALANLEGTQFILLPCAGLITLIPLLCLAKGIKGIHYSLSGMIGYVNPTLQMIVAVFIYNEVIETTDLITYIFVWVAVALFVVDSFIQNHKHQKQLQSQQISNQQEMLGEEK